MPRVAKTRAGGRWSEARWWSFLRSGLRRMSVRWPVKYDVLRDARRKSRSENKRLKWEFRCAQCGGWFAAKAVAVDHIVPVGTLRAFADLPGFVERLFCEAAGYQVVCTNCHAAKTAAERDVGCDA